MKLPAAPFSTPWGGRRAQALLALLLLLTSAWIAYGQVTAFPFISLDDPDYVSANPVVQHGLTLTGWRWAWSTLACGNWHPLTWLSLMIDGQIYGAHAGGYHLTNFLLHVLATLLLFGWLLLATARLWPSAAVAGLFCIHPTRAESVVWVAERKDVLSTVCFFLLLLAYTRYAQTRRRRFYFGALAALCLGLLAKPMLVTAPFVLLLVDVWPLNRWRRARDLPPLCVEKLSFAALAAASCVVTFLAQRNGGATHSLSQLPLAWRVAGSLAGYAAYLGELCWPVHLGVFYPYWNRLPLAQILLTALLLALATSGAACLFRTRPYLLVGWLWFLGMLVPVIGLVQVGSQSMADRYTYQPFVGLFIILCWTLTDLWRALPRGRALLAAGEASAFAACLVLCCRQVGYWRDDTTLLRHTLAVARPDAATYSMLGDFYAPLERPVEAEAAYRLALRLQPNNVDLVTKLAYLQFDQGHWDQAYLWLRQVAALPSCRDPVVFDKLGLALTRLNRPDEAQAAFHRSLQLRPGSLRPLAPDAVFPLPLTASP